nr:uncharacterized mitochondrial protein AtMg00810-like [Tanacetum cinerariifolium]
MYCLVVTDDYSRFTWVFFLATKDETSGILKSFITRIENLVDHKVKVIRCDNRTEFKNREMNQFCEMKATKDETSGILKSFITRIENLVDHKVKVIRCDNRTEFKNREMNQFCEMKGILRQFSVAKTPQQNGVAEKRNMTLTEAARTMLANSKTPTLSFMRLFGCPVTILNTLDHLGKFDGKADEGFFVGYSLNSKVFRVFNSRTRIVEQNLHIRFSESTPNVVGSGPNWLFDIDALTRTINYKTIVTGSADLVFSQNPKSSHDDGSKPSSNDEKKVDEDPRKESECDSCIERFKLDRGYAGRASTIQVTRSLDFSGFTKWKKGYRYKKCFFYGKIEEEVYVCQPLGFEDLDFLDRVYKVGKALYELYQAPRAWYETLSTYLLDNGFQRGKINKSLFIKRHKSDILLVQVYVDDIIFGSTEKELCNTFEKLMHKKFQMSSMGKLTFFLGLQVKQKKDGIFISQDKYDKDGEEVDVHMYRLMIGSLMYLTSLRPDIMFSKCACARYQVNLKVSHLHAMKRIFSSKLMLLGITYYCWVNVNAVDDEVVDKELGNSLVRATTTASSLEAEQDSGGGHRCQETMGDSTAQTRFESVSKHFNDSLLARGNILRSDEDRMKLDELMALCTTLQNRVLELDKTKTSQHNDIASLKKRVKKLEMRNRSRTHKLKRLYKVGLIARVESLDDEESLGEDASKQERIEAIDAV